MPTPHINAAPGDFAETILLPGDPLRAQYIAEHFLTDAKQVNSVRNMFGFTGKYKGNLISVMGTGMGIPSCSIYAKELITDYGVRNLVRIGTCGSISHEVKVREIIIALGASTNSSVNRSRLMGYDFSATASYNLLEKAVNTARSLKIPCKIGNVFSADLFYDPQGTALYEAAQKMGILGAEMEAAGLYGVAAEYNANALTILTVSDHILTKETTTAEERQTSFHEMMKLALESFAC